MRLGVPRIVPLGDEGWTQEQAALLEPFAKRKFIPNLYRTLAQGPAMAQAINAALRQIRSNKLSEREREILILRTGWLCRAGYEWNAHVHLGAKAGLTGQDIERIKHGSAAPDWTDREAALCRAAEELCADQFVSDECWGQLKSHFDDQQCMDAIFVVGFYVFVCMLLNSCGVQLDRGAKLDPSVLAAWGSPAAGSD
jgi:alkylhydroperoxidase family enzyme